MAGDSLHLTCVILCLMSASLGCCLGFLVLAILKAGSDNHWPDDHDGSWPEDEQRRSYHDELRCAWQAVVLAILAAALMGCTIPLPPIHGA